MGASPKRAMGMGRGKIYPARHAGQLRNPLRRLIQSPPRLVASLDLEPDAVVLELGCGPGFFSQALAKAIPRGRLHLFDFQREMLRMARERMGRERAASFACVQGDGLALPYRDGTFDLVLLVTVLGELPDREACLAEAMRVLKPGGRLAISEARNDADFTGPGEVRALAEGVGFEFLSRRGLRWSYTALFRKPVEAR